MRTLFTFILLTHHLVFFSQQWAWAKASGIYSSMGKTAIKANATGDLFIASNITFQTSHTVLSRVNLTGQLTWSASIDGWNTALIDVSVDKNNNCYVLGWFASNLVFPDTTLWEGNSWELFIAAYAPNGHRKWVKTFPNAANWGNFITNDKNGDLIFASAKNWMVVKYDQNGNTVWQNTYGCNNYINGLITDNANNIYLTSTFSNSLGINGNTYYAGAGNSYNPYGFICKINPSGNVKNVQTVKGATFNDLGLDSLNNYYVAGTYHDSLKIGQTVLTHSCASVYDPCERNFIAKFDTNSYCSWIKEHNSSFDQVEVTKAGDCYVAGTLSDTLSFSPVSISDMYSGAVYVFRLNSAGIGQWAVKDSSASGWAAVGDMSRSENCHLFISGLYNGQPSFGTSMLPSGQYPYYTAALNENVTLTLVIQTQKNDAGGSLFPNPSNGRVTLKQHGDVVISGVYDVFGQRIEKIIPATGTEINLQENGKGIYFIELSHSGKKEYRKIIIE